MSGDLKRVLLDTSIIIDIFKNELPDFNKIISSEIFVPSIVIGELCFGAYNSGSVSNKLEQIFEFSNAVEIVNVNETTAKHYGEIKTELKKIGMPIPENDIWIAAISIELDIPLLTKDKHFSHIKKLKQII